MCLCPIQLQQPIEVEPVFVVALSYFEAPGGNQVRQNARRACSIKDKIQDDVVFH